MLYAGLLDAAPLTTWLGAQREGLPLEQCAKRLRQALIANAPFQEVYYFSWQANSLSYVQADDAPRLPPSLEGAQWQDDRLLQKAVSKQPCLSFAQLHQLGGCLAGRLQRAGLTQGYALALSLQTGVAGVLLVQSDSQDCQAWLGWLQFSLQQILLQTQPIHSTGILLPADPQPALVFDDQAQVLECNLALQRLISAKGDGLECLLPVNYVALVRACLRQNRAIEQVQGGNSEHCLSWSFIPQLSHSAVLARCQDATAQLRESREGQKAQRLYRLITENTTDLISRHAPNGVFLDASPASWTLLGYWPEQLRGRSVHELMHEQDLLSFMPAAAAELESAGYHTMTYRIRHQLGYYLWFETACRAIRDTYTGTVVEVVSVSRDVSARIVAEEKRRRLAEVVQVNTDLVLFIEPPAKLTYLNASAVQALQIDRQQALPSLDQVLAAEDFARLQQHGWAQADAQGSWSAEVRLFSLAGEPLLVSLVLLAHRGAGDEHYYSLVARDMTERELREAQQRRHQDELAHTARLITLGELASGIAHEINQPLAAVMNYASASQRYLHAVGTEPSARDRVAQGLARISDHANHASQVIKRLRAFLRKGQRRMQALDLAEIAREAIRFCQWEASAAQVQIVDELTQALPAVYADRILLEQVLLNLLRNAIEANREQHPHCASSIWLKAKQVDGYLSIEVHDQGPGLDTDLQLKLFTPFFTSKADGLGLGLSMSRSIIEGFGGTLEAFSGQEQGLCLECRLPLSRGENTEQHQE